MASTNFTSLGGFVMTGPGGSLWLGSAWACAARAGTTSKAHTIIVKTSDCGPESLIRSIAELEGPLYDVSPSRHGLAASHGGLEAPGLQRGDQRGVEGWLDAGLDLDVRDLAAGVDRQARTEGAL